MSASHELDRASVYRMFVISSFLYCLKFFRLYQRKFIICIFLLFRHSIRCSFSINTVDNGDDRRRKWGRESRHRPRRVPIHPTTSATPHLHRLCSPHRPFHHRHLHRISLAPLLTSPPLLPMLHQPAVCRLRRRWLLHPDSPLCSILVRRALR